MENADFFYFERIFEWNIEKIVKMCNYCETDFDPISNIDIRTLDDNIR